MNFLTIFIIATTLFVSAPEARANRTLCAGAFDEITLEGYRQSVETYNELYPELAWLRWPALNFTPVKDARDGMVWRYLAHRALLDRDSPYSDTFSNGYLRYSAKYGTAGDTQQYFIDLVHRNLVKMISERGFAHDKAETLERHEGPPDPHIWPGDVEAAVQHALESAPPVSRSRGNP